ncbi:potassium-transporting ATPase subunit KdpB [Pigmentibacter ruber]|uniref:potassium-transporting ATPase subunit KdpB n=1 Tax=Pigmentibacter ruber TaxID=2683196 RepID=UPI00131EAFB8|nr:potassium-transporting ATPase subunit KdpB [Pigmentibacter ruber]BFD32651.1 potassium-transporting ATPase subunit KdpB [Pigmentibacter ruber]
MQNSTLLNYSIIIPAIKDSFKKLNPIKLYHNPVMFVVEVTSIIVTIVFLNSLFFSRSENISFQLQITIWLWFTILFANFSEAIAEGRGKAQAESLKKTRKQTVANVYDVKSKTVQKINASQLTKGSLVKVSEGELIPCDGTVIEGMATVDESAITGESAPVIRESGGDRSAVTGGTTVLSDEIIVEVTAEPGKTFLDKMIALVEGAERKKSPNEVALNILLCGLTIIFLIVVVTLKPIALFHTSNISLIGLIALLVCLIPTTIGGLLAAIGIAGMDRVLQRNVIAMSGKAVEVSGDIDVLLLDKTGTITIGNRMASEFLPSLGVNVEELAQAAYASSYFDQTPEGRSIVKLATEMNCIFNLAGEAKAIPFSAETRMSGLDTLTDSFRKGSKDAIAKWLQHFQGKIPEEINKHVNDIAKMGGTPLVVVKGSRVLGVIYLKDVVKPGIKERFVRIRAMGIKTIMITGDNKLTAQSIAQEAGVDDFLAEAKPEDKLNLIKSLKNEGFMVAMTGDGTNDAPALAQADVGLAMNTGTQAAREAGNMIDLDSDPTKVIEVVEIGKQLLITRGALTTFSIANDIAKYFAIIPSLFLTSIPSLKIFNIMNLASPESAILSAVIFNALIIIILIPLALKGVKYRPQSASKLLRYNIVVYGLGGIIFPFIGIKLIDIILVSLNLI